MTTYIASNIKSDVDLVQVVKYIADQCSFLAGQTIGTDYPVTYVTIFSHTNEEFEKLKTIITQMGDVEGVHNGPRVLLKNPIVVRDSIIKQVRIRHPDLSRPQVGCADYDLNYDEFVRTKPASDHIFFIGDRPDFDMYEFRHPDFDVLGYVVGPDKK